MRGNGTMTAPDYLPSTRPKHWDEAKTRRIARKLEGKQATVKDVAAGAGVGRAKLKSEVIRVMGAQWWEDNTRTGHEGRAENWGVL